MNLVDDTAYDDPCCKYCGQEMSWDDCDACGGEGEFDAYELEPTWYNPGDTEPCHQCMGIGGWWWCSNQDCPAKRDDND